MGGTGVIAQIDELLFQGKRKSVKDNASNNQMTSTT